MHPRTPASIRTRLTLWYSAVLAGIVLTFAIGSILVIREVLARRADRFLRDVVDTFVGDVVQANDTGTSLDARIREALLDYRFREITVLVFDRGRLVHGSPSRRLAASVAGEREIELDVGALSQAVRAHAPPAVFTLDDEEGGFRIATASAIVSPDSLTVAAVQSWHGYSETLELITLAYALVVPALLLMSGLGGYWLTSRSLAPIADMSRKAASIGRRNLDERMPAQNPNDELGQLAAVFNDMLERLANSFTQQQQFMQDASHELRSPIAAIRMEADVTLRHAHRSEDSYRDTLSTIRQSAIRLSRIVDDLFVLAHHDDEQLRAESGIVDLGEVVHEAVRSVRALASDRGIRLTLADAPEAPVRGDASELRRIVVNLVENAVRYGAAESTVFIVVSAEGQDAFAVRVRDEGPGIPAEARTRIFDRFYRVAQPDGSAFEGSGLGLAIARVLAERHGGRLELEESSLSGSTFRLVVPRSELA